MGKRNSLAARDTSAGSGGLWGAAWMESASITPPNTMPTASPVARCAASPPHGFFSTQSSVRPKEPYWSPLMSAINAREGLGPAVLATWSACIAPSWSERAAMNASGAARRPASPIRGPRAFFAVVPTASPTHTTTDQETFCTRSARIGFAPFNVPKPAASTTRMTSITSPSSTASHPTCRRARQASNDLFISPSIFSPQGRVYFFLAGGAERAPWSPQRLASLRGARRSGLLGDSNCLGLSSTRSHVRMPRCPMFEHRVQNDQQLPHARREGHRFRFPGRTQAVIERANDRIVARRHEGPHIEHGADLGAAAPDRAFAAQRAAVAVERGDGRQRLGLLIRQGAQLRAHDLGEVREDLRIERIRFGELPRRLGKIADLPGIDDHDGQRGRRQGPDERQFQPPGGLQENHGRRHRAKLVHDLRDPRVVVGRREAPGRPQGDVQLGLGDINTDKHGSIHHDLLLGGPALHDTGSTAHATVRALQRKGMTTATVARSPRTADPTVYHAPVDDALYHRRPRRKIQGPDLSPPSP